jgi:hypothetical protein
MENKNRPGSIFATRPAILQISNHTFQIMSATVRFAGTNGNTCVV